MCLAVPGKILSIEEQDGTRMAKVDFGGVVKDVCLAYLPDIGVGDYTIVHVGFAIQKLDEASALETLDLFRGMGLLEEEFGEESRESREESRESREESREEHGTPGGQPNGDGGPGHERSQAGAEAAR
jgi:hydrogenase expression/formation protein HypC